MVYAVIGETLFITQEQPKALSTVFLYEFNLDSGMKQLYISF